MRKEFKKKLDALTKKWDAWWDNHWAKGPPRPYPTCKPRNKEVMSTIPQQKEKQYKFSAAEVKRLYGYAGTAYSESMGTKFWKPDDEELVGRLSDMLVLIRSEEEIYPTHPGEGAGRP